MWNAILGSTEWLCTIVHNTIFVVHNGPAPCVLYWSHTMAVNHCALCAQRYIGGAQWSCTILHRVHNAILVVHNGCPPLYTGCRMLDWWGTMAVHHCAPGAQHYTSGAQRCFGGAQWLPTIVHRVQDAIFVFRNGCALFCTGCTLLDWWCTMVMKHCAPAKGELSGCGVGCFTKKNAFFVFFCFFDRFWPFLAVGWFFFMFFGVFLFFHGGIRYKRILWYQGTIDF